MIPERQTPSASVTFATGVEGGPMEAMVVRLVESLRRYGGRFAGCPFVAVQPRFGPPIRKHTRAAFDRLGVTFRSVRPTHGRPWFVWLNKPTTLLAAEAVATTDTVVWVDADMLVLGEPADLELPTDVDFAACPADKNAGSTGPDDVFDPYWQQSAKVLGVRADDLPWVTTHREGARIRFYFNAGLFAYRRRAAFAAPLLADCQAALSAHFKSTSQGIKLADQVTLGLTAHRLGLRWRPLGWDYNFAVGNRQWKAKLYDPARLADVRILHYHDFLWSYLRPTLLDQLRPTRPDVADWLASTPALTNDLPLPWKVLAKGLGMARGRAYRRHEAGCVAY